MPVAVPPCRGLADGGIEPGIMRLFTAITLPESIFQELERLVRQLRPAARIRWSRIPDLHVTTKFIGEWPAARLGELTAALAKLPPREQIPIAVRGLGWFPNERAPRVFWAGIEAPDTLRELAADTEQRLERLGIARERRRYSPHLTLARIKAPAEVSRLRQMVARLPSVEFGAFTTGEFHLYSSELHSSGSIYTSLKVFPLAAK